LPTPIPTFEPSIAPTCGPDSSGLGFGSNCFPCNPGTYGALPDVCLPCDIGRYQDVAGSIECKKCPLNRLSPNLGYISYNNKLYNITYNISNI